MPYIIESPFPSFNDTDGSPLNNGYVYVGSANLNPVTDPIPVYWDAALTQPAAQPIRTINGYLSRNGSPGRIYTNFITYSFRVTNNKGEQVFSDLNYTDPTSSAGSTYQQVITAIAGQTVFNLSRTYIPGTNNLFIYRNGLRLIVGQDYNETGYSQVTLTAGADNGDEFVFDIGYNYDSAASVDAQDVTYKLPAIDSVFTNVEAKLSETVSPLDFGAAGDGTTNDTDAFDKLKTYINTTQSNATVQMAGRKYNVTPPIWNNDVAPTLMPFDAPSALGLFEGSDANPDTFTNDPVLWVQKITKYDASSPVEHNVGGVFGSVKLKGSGVAGTVESSGTWIGILGNGVADGQNMGTESAPDYDLEGNIIGVAGFARSNKPSDGIVTALWGYAQTPTMTDTEFNAWSDAFVTTALELNLDIEHKDPGAKTIVAGKGTTLMAYLMNYQESAIQRNLSFGIAFNSNPLTGYTSVDPDIDHWNGFHTGILIDKVQTNGILFGQYFKNGSYGIRFPDTWLTQRPAAAIHLGNNTLQMGQYTGASFYDNDLWHNGGYLYFRYSGTNEQLCTVRNQAVRFQSATAFQIGLRNILRLSTAGASVNNFAIFPAATGATPAFAAEGDDTNIDIELRPKGTGRVWIGAWTTNDDTAVNGYITVKDSTGITRKIATIA